MEEIAKGDSNRKIKEENTIYGFGKGVKQLNPDMVEEEYAKQNWHVSKVLSTKNKNVRNAILLFGLALFFQIMTFCI